MGTGANRQKILQMAERCYAERRFAQAEDLCRKLLGRRRGDVEALVLLARIAFDKGQHDNAAAHLEQALRIQPRNVELVFALAQTHQKSGRFDEAMAGYEKVLRHRPGHEPSITGIAGILDRRGDPEQAIERLEPHIAAGAEDAAMATLFARLQMQAGAFDRAIEVASRHVEDDAPPAALRSLHFVLGQALEKAGEHDRSFDAYSRANALVRAPFNPKAAAARFDELMRVCSVEGLAAMPRSSNDSDHAVFVVGMPRSGTTLVERIIDAHPEAHGGGELDFMPEIADGLAREIGSTMAWPQCLRDLGQEDVDMLAARYVEQTRRLAPDARRIVDKQLGNDQALGLVSRLLPSSRVIWCERDPLDTCLSCFAQALSPVLHPYASDLRSLGWMYRQVQRIKEHWLAVLDLPMMLVQYEELIDSTESVSREIISFCGLDWNEQCLQYHTAGRAAHTLSYDQVRRPIYRSSLGRGERFGAHLDPLREALLVRT
ncbi:MAG: tetratricopeptide repeat-containing sulfotransferase family protein [Planctomycetota bacterium]|jgi:tetratricopeptide (TPR) repeat protein